jgi:hypothetical protein
LVVVAVVVAVVLQQVAKVAVVLDSDLEQMLVH